MLIKYILKTVCTAIIFFCFQLGVGFAQSNCGGPFVKIIGSPLDNERGYSVAASEIDQSLYVGGVRNDSVALIKLHMDGSFEWTRIFDIIPGRAEHINGMFVDSDGFLVLAGTAGNPNLGGTIFVVKYNPVLNAIIWAKELISTSSNYCSGIIEMGSGGNYLVSNNPVSPNNAELIELDRLTGEINEDFAKHYHLGSSETIYDLVYHEGWLYSTGRFTDGPTPAEMRNTLLKLNASNGLPEWTILGHRPNNVEARLYGIDLVIDQNLIYSVSLGDDNGTSIDLTKVYIQQTTLNGEVQWIKQYELPAQNDWVDEIIVSDNGFVVLARNRTAPSDLYVFKINRNGDVVWANKFDFSFNDNSIFSGGITSQMAQLGDHIYFTAYKEMSLNADMVLVKINLDGSISEPCSFVSPISIPVNTISNYTFYNSDPVVFTYVPEALTLSVNMGIELNIQVENLCYANQIITDTLEVSICAGETFESYNQTGVYADTFQIADACDSIRILQLTVIPLIMESLSMVICEGDSIDGYLLSGIYADTFQLATGCDSIRILELTVISCVPIIHYSLDACNAYMHTGTNMDYSEFIPDYPTPLTCAEVTASILYRSPPQENKHSCTPGLEGTPAMCVSALSSCTYVAGHQASVVFEVHIQPEIDSVFRLTGLSFYEKSPSTYSWIDGGSGPNNYPTLYGIRILKDDIEVFRKSGIFTNVEWSLQEFSFTGLPEFRVEENTVFRFELLSYCPVGNGAEVSAWDLEDIMIFASCAGGVSSSGIVQGGVFARDLRPIPNVELELFDNPLFLNPRKTITDNNGEYLFELDPLQSSYTLRGSKADSPLNGVSTLDLIHIQKHLLGIEHFRTVEEYIAADVNSTGTVNVIDLVDLRKLLLGKYDEFPNTPAWQIGVVLSELNPEGPHFLQRVAHVQNQEQGIVNIDFVGIKTGDLNNDVVIDLTDPIITKREGQNFKMKCVSRAWLNGDSAIDIISDQDVFLEGFQFALENFQVTGTTIIGEAIPIQTEHYVLDNSSTLRVSWNHIPGIQLKQGDLLFRIVYESANTILPPQSLNLSTNILTAEVYNDRGAIPLQLEWSDTQVGKHQMTDFQFHPNPFHGTSWLRFEVQTHSLVEFRFYSSTGHLLHKIKKMYDPGIYQEEITNQEVGLYNGIIFCHRIENGFMQIRKLVVLE